MLKACLFKSKCSTFVVYFLYMKIFTYIIFVLAVVFIGINAMKLDFNNLFEGDSLIALIGILSVLCAVVVLLVFKLSKSIEEKLKNQ